MKASPFIANGQGKFDPCEPDQATHVKIHMPGPIGLLILPVITHGTRQGTPCWTWNGDTEKPTLRPSVLSQMGDVRCHSWINDGHAQFLSDSNHELANQTVALLDVEE